MLLESFFQICGETNVDFFVFQGKENVNVITLLHWRLTSKNRKLVAKSDLAQLHQTLSEFDSLERLTGIEPVSSPWQGEVLPLNHSRVWCPGSESNWLRKPLPKLVGLYHHPINRSWALVQDYCCDALASLYTFRETYALLGLARGCPPAYGFSPSSPNFSQDSLLNLAPKILGLRSTNELPGHVFY